MVVFYEVFRAVKLTVRKQKWRSEPSGGWSIVVGWVEFKIAEDGMSSGDEQ